MANVLEKAHYIRSERKEAAQNCHQVHSVDTLLTVENKANWQNMWSCKSLLILLMLLAVSFGQHHNLIECRPKFGDTLLQRVPSEKSFKVLQYVSETVYIDVGKNIINCFRALDQWSDGTGGKAEILYGGVGYSYVIVKITSKFNRGFHFVIEVYGQPWVCKYLRNCCANFRTCPHKHIITAVTLRFTSKSCRL
jgi:hypothetical protein